ncbi:hypothetical protein F4803DRAFT_574908 [Xylaria telfairii]|nr:hypothetical protein F4803DRAFT_574908 [Xylaria telfairii]
MSGASDWFAEALHRFKPQIPDGKTSKTSQHEQNLTLLYDNKRDTSQPSDDIIPEVGDGMSRIAEQTLLNSTSFYEFKALQELFQPEEDVLLRAFDQILFRYHRPAWETIGYLIFPHHRAAVLMQQFEASQETFLHLGYKTGLIQEGGEPGDVDRYEAHRPQLLALWRVWAYSIVSIEGFVNGQCIVDQVAWLRGSVARPVCWTEAWTRDRSWRFDTRNGISGQCNARQRTDEREAGMNDMLQAWQALVARWCRCVTQQQRPDCTVVREVEEALIHVLSRPTGPVDVLCIFQKEEPAYHRLYFGNAIRMVRLEDRYKEDSFDSYK